MFSNQNPWKEHRKSLLLEGVNKLICIHFGKENFIFSDDQTLTDLLAVNIVFLWSLWPLERR